MIQTVFKRYELKYLITKEQKQRILRAAAPYMARDQYGRTLIRNIYFDTDSFLLVRRSIERPVYKEKLRIRSYGTSETAFVELKKKYESIVYKRRLSLPADAAMDWIAGKTPCPEDTQIAREIGYFLSYYKGLSPKVLLTYEREAFYAFEDSAFRVTFDDNILCRETDVSLRAPVGGGPLLGEDRALMEIKCAGGLPLWMVRVLSEEKIYKTSFSKYGTAYQKYIYPEVLCYV